MSAYLLDTNILSDLIRNPAGLVAQRLAEVGEDAVATSVIVAAELRYGAVKRGSPRLTERVEMLLAEMRVLAIEPPADVAYGEIRAALEVQGTPIGSNDLLIAAHAHSLGWIVVTANVGEFRRVAGLKVENWLAPGT